jgi:hypothetical protein
MTFIQLYAKGEVEIPEEYQYLMVVSDTLDSEGNWIPAHVQFFRVAPQVWMALNRVRQTGDKVVVRASASFSGLAKKMGLPVLYCEWGVL